MFDNVRIFEMMPSRITPQSAPESSLAAVQTDAADHTQRAAVKIIFLPLTGKHGGHSAGQHKTDNAAGPPATANTLKTNEAVDRNAGRARSSALPPIAYSARPHRVTLKKPAPAAF